ncbi:hypothetical protein FRACYDRAFT_244175 [Fragilariopsis cylindrus CCMP1102]|uniref:Uncharacterized protein n=1 Tax=Fragilariopsis cylindrus CCMP1102 TaxID=635003 RepID=A0A1E7F3Z4_9STRA|nr:hypothetical protein FRACYDRAFT_244175 [Fragilariopsis cylindrus CCMP1102]|eukprot:OEU12902.1 hypothetical protein FRACYDRAFT_244175 [Fragilariopsis cylindrus CCMP1102]
MSSTNTNTNTMISRSKLLDISDLNSYFTSSLFLLFGLADGGNDAIITDEDNSSSISKYLVIVYQRIIRNVSISNHTVQLIFEFITTIYLGINNIGDDASIVLSPAAHLLGFGYKTSTTTTSSSNNVENSNSSSSNVINKRRRRRIQRLQILLYAFLRIVLPKLYEIMKRKGIDYYVNKKEEEEKDMSSSSLSPLPPSSPLTLQLSHQQQKQEKKIDVRIKLLKQISSNRKKLIIQKIVQCIDTTIPIIRLSLLLSCWNTNQKNQNTNQHGGNLSMFLSGLSFTTTATSANTMSSSPLPIASSTLFVLYAHRRWFHREFVDLVWNRIGRRWVRMPESGVVHLASTTGHDLVKIKTK